MLEPFEVSGHWWLPDAEDEIIAGTLRFSQEQGGKLELFGLFGRPQAFVAPPLEYEIILGKSLDGQCITLSRCVAVNYSMELLVEGGSCKYHAHFIFIGDHYPSEKQITFKSIHVSYTDLLSWVGINKQGIEYAPRDASIQVTYQPHDPIVISVNSELEFSIEFHGGMDSSREDGSFILAEHVYFVLRRTSGEIPFLDFVQQMRVFGNLLTFATGRLEYPIRMFGLTDQSQQASHGEKPYYEPIEIYYQLLELPQERKLLPTGDMLFQLSDIEERLEAMIPRWFASAVDLPDVHTLFFGSRYERRLFVDHKFLNLIQAIETYYRSRLSSPEVYKAAHKARMEKILQAITPVLDAEDLTWIENLMKGNAAPSLKNQFQAVADRYAPVLDKWFGDHSELASEVIATRNQLTHRTRQKKAKTTSIDLFAVNRQLLLLLECALLEELGFPQEEIIRLQNDRRSLPL